MEEISTSFCFICLLHLANERGLKLDAGSGGRDVEGMEVDDEDEEVNVGDIWGLKVRGLFRLGRYCSHATCRIRSIVIQQLRGVESTGRTAGVSGEAAPMDCTVVTARNEHNY